MKLTFQEKRALRAQVKAKTVQVVELLELSGGATWSHWGSGGHRGHGRLAGKGPGPVSQVPDSKRYGKNSRRKSEKGGVKPEEIEAVERMRN